MKSAIGRIYESTEYDKFKVVIGNRPIKTSGNKWQRLYESMQKYGQLSPGIIDEQLNVLDGQHRLEACKRLKIPFKFAFTNSGVSAEVIGGINTSRSWGLMDYIRYYSSQTDNRAINYKLLQCLMSEFKELTPSAMLSFALARGDGGGAYQKVVEAGDLTFTQEEYDIVRNCLTELKALGYMRWQHDNHVVSRPFWNTVGYAYRHPMVNMERLLKILYENENRIPSSGRVPDLLNRFSELYNKRLNKNNKVYLDIDYEQGKYRKWV